MSPITPTREERQARNDADAQGAFIAKKAEIDAMPARLQSLSDEHFAVRPDELTWATSVRSDATPNSSAG